MAPRPPQPEPTTRLLDATTRITEDAATREDDGLTGTSLGDAIAVITAGDPTATVHPGVAGRHARPPFVNVAPLDAVTFAEGLATEDFGRQHQVHQVSVFRHSAAAAITYRATVLALFAVAGRDRWALVDDDLLRPYEDDTLDPPAWVAPFTIRDLAS